MGSPVLAKIGLLLPKRVFLGANMGQTSEERQRDVFSLGSAPFPHVFFFFGALPQHDLLLKRDAAFHARHILNKTDTF